ncbi:alpha-1,2-fucosyltransferase [Bacteroides timonensis]|uniref:alpha-1,2-fucosyltransferase n=1 Tax=Bacteroides timonensis TaxID=1470345 RepID=UPI0004B30048|nr:alpha-1,2-fucosyltransferase [Bacteroides timonensis]
MKIVIPAWGLGNVMFQYAFLCELRTRSKDGCCFVVHRRMKFDHQGYELDKLFKKVNPYKGLNLFQKAYIHTIEFLGGRGLPHYKLITWFFKEIWPKENFIFYEDIFQYGRKNCMLCGTWQSLKYFEHVQSEVKETFTFDEKMLSPYTKEFLMRIIETSDSVSIHVRRGDYASGNFDGFLLCCPIDYFKRAVEYMKAHLAHPVFYVFSDDIEYVREYFGEENMVFIDGNRKEDSWQDMFLMSRCHHNIIANSTFSWWGAYLNAYNDKIVIAPKRWWYYFEKDDVVPESWLRM